MKPYRKLSDAPIDLAAKRGDMAVMAACRVIRWKKKSQTQALKDMKPYFKLNSPAAINALLPAPSNKNNTGALPACALPEENANDRS